MPQEGAVVTYRPSELHVISELVAGPQHDSQESGQTSSSQCGGKSRPGVVVVAGLQWNGVSMMQSVMAAAEPQVEVYSDA